MAKYTTNDDLDLFAELGVDTAPAQAIKRSPREERIIAGFEEIERFLEEQSHLPQHGEDRGIFERLYAVRLDRLRELTECRELLKPLDLRGLLETVAETALPPDEDIDDKALLAELGMDTSTENDVTQLTHVRSRQEIKAAEEIAQRTPCKDFKQFKPVF